MSRKYNPFDEDSFLWSVARENMRDTIKAYKGNDMFEKGSAAYNFAIGTLVEMLVFLKDEDIISGWDADELTDLLDSMCK